MRYRWNYRHEPECLRGLVGAYWRTLLGAAGVLIASAVLYGGAALLSALNLDAGGVALLTGGGAALNRAELKTTLDGFGARKERYESLRENRPQIADPSK